MKYLGFIIAICIIVFGVFALYRYAPFLVSEAVDGANFMANLITSF